jgi:5-methylcytosine-specific restriction protein A
MNNPSRNKIFEAIGTSPTNPRWSWCALAKDNSRAAFTLWKDEIKDKTYRLLAPLEGSRNIHGYNDQKRILEIVIENRIPSFGLVCIAENIHAHPRSIKSIQAEYLIPLRLRKEGDFVYADLKKEIHLLEVSRQAIKKKENAILDLSEPPAGNSSPDRALKAGFVVKRDPKVRKYVIDKSQGKCEYCGECGFTTTSGMNYIEAHHIISLASSGKDTIENVIALCPNHHREAHFGAKAEALEERFVEIVTERNK